jgi:hypothetical protein
MKIALCFSGHMRDLNETKTFWTELIEKYKMDVYASFWDEENEDKGDTINNFLKIYTPKKWEVERYDVFKETTLDIASMYVDPPSFFNDGLKKAAKEFRQISMYYKIWRANMLSKHIGIEYDLVIRARTDIVLDDNFEIRYNQMLNIPMGRIKAQMWPDSASITDIFAYGTPKIMDYYAFVFLKAMEYQQAGHYMIPAEHLLHVHFKKIHIQIRSFPNYLLITRVWKDSPHEYYNNYVSPAEETIECSDEKELNVNPAGTFVKDVKKEFKVD